PEDAGRDSRVWRRAQRLQQGRAGHSRPRVAGRPGLRRHRGPPAGRRAPDALHHAGEERLLQQVVRRLSMGLFDFLKAKKNTAETAKNRLQIIIAQERSSRGAPDYLPLLRRELLEVIKKYVNVDVDAVKVDLIKDGDHDVLDISVALPEGQQG